MATIPKELSQLEETLALYLRCEKVTDPEREYQALPDRAFRWDFAWPNERVLVEVHGQIWKKGGHSSGTGIIRDTEKQALATIAGWRAIAVTEKQIQDGSAVEWIKQLLANHYQ